MPNTAVKLSPNDIELCRCFVDPYAFFCRYFQDKMKSGYTTIRNAQWQIDAVREWGKAIMARDERGAPKAGMIAEAWPREFGKTTFSRAVLLWAILCGHRRYTVLFRVNGLLASSELASYLRLFDDRNSLLVQDFGLQDWPEYVSRRKGMSWSTEKIHLRNIRGEISCIQGLGAGSSPRGLEDSGNRPDLIKPDDIETTDGTLSKAIRTRNAAWLEDDVKPLGSNALILFTQTTISPNSLMAVAQNDPQWKSRHMPALDENDESTWPERYSSEFLRKKRDNMPASTWLADYQNLPQSNEATLFPVDSWRIYEDEGMTPPSRNVLTRVIIGVDLAFSAKKSADYTAISAWGEDSAKHKHHLGTIRGRWATPEEVIRQILHVDSHIGGADKICVEDTSSSKHFVGIARQSIGGRVIPISTQGLDKTARARMVMANWELGQAWRHKADTMIAECMYSFRPDVTDQEDDVLDAAVYALLGMKRGQVAVYR